MSDLRVLSVPHEEGEIVGLFECPRCRGACYIPAAPDEYGRASSPCCYCHQQGVVAVREAMRKKPTGGG